MAQTKAKTKAKSANPLLAELSKTDPVCTVNARSPWHERMAIEDPEKFQNLIDIVEDFIDGGEAFRKLHDIRRLHQWLLQKEAFTKPVSYQTFRIWFVALK